jgi:hypothetical protein
MAACSGLLVGVASVALAGCSSVLGYDAFSFGDAAPGQAQGGGGGGGGCVAQSCEALQAECGSIPDGCGSVRSCGECPSGQQCGGGGTNRCGSLPCSPLTCADTPGACGVVSDGCASTLDCGACGGPCVPATCASKGAECGSLADGCGGTLECGGCPNGACSQNRCSSGPCTPTTCQAAGAQCGSLPDGCGQTLDCGACPNGACNGNKCACTAKTCGELKATCGSVSDGCGGTLDCGTCANGDTCGGGGTANQCGGSAQQLCVDIINQYRATLGRPALARWTSAEACSDGEAKSDSQTGKPHGAFGQCGEYGQNECPGWSGPPQSLLPGCLKMMWNEGPGGGHYENMASTKFHQVACGFSNMGTGSVWAVQNFR